MTASNAGLKIPFGYRNGRYYGPKNVPNGDKCDCVCPGCESPLRANQGSPNSKRRAYFSHQVKSECLNGYETAVHKYAKQLIADELLLFLPTYRVEGRSRSLPGGYPNTFREQDFIGKGRTTNFETADVEKTVHPYRPDVSMHGSEATIYVEVCVTNPVGPEKAKFFEGKNLLEIYLKGLDSDLVFDAEAFKKVVLHQAPREWIHCNLFNQEVKEHFELQQRLYEQEAIRYQKKINQQKAADIAKQKQQEQFEQKKSDERAPYLARLEALDRFYTDEGMNQRRYDLQKSSEEKLQAVEQHFSNSGKIPPILTKENPGGWIFNVHWVVWQSFIYVKYIQQQSIGSIFNAFDVKKHIVKKYGVLPVIKTLNSLKQAQKAQGKSRKKYYADKGAWFFTDEENGKIVSPYRPVISFLHSLERFGIIESSPGQEHIFTIKQNCLETQYKILEMKQREHAEQLAYRHRSEQTRLLHINKLQQAEEKKKRETIEAHIEMRIREVTEQVEVLYNKKAKFALRCHFCASMSEASAVACTTCGREHLEEVEITPEFVRTIEARLKCDPRMRNSLW